VFASALVATPVAGALGCSSTLQLGPRGRIRVPWRVFAL
jgi:hypothetical protein